MRVDQSPTIRDKVSRLDRLMSDTSRQVQRVHTLCDRISYRLTAMRGQADGDTEGGWQRII